MENIHDLICTIESLFEVDLSNLDLQKYTGLPNVLQYLYAIEDFFVVHDCKFETIRFFNNQFHLIPYAKLKLDSNVFDIVYENQNNWRVALNTTNESISLSEHYELPYNSFLPYTLEEFLISFALHEIVFNCQYFCQLEYQDIAKLSQEVKLKPLWNGKMMIDYPIDLYYTNDDMLVMNAGWIVLASNNEQKFMETKQLLKTPQ